MYNPEQIRNFYNSYGILEWNRLVSTAYQRISFHLHMHFLQGHIGRGKKVLDAGSGAGRFSTEIARSGSEVTLLDISDEQISIARDKLMESGLAGRVSDFIVGDICVPKWRFLRRTARLGRRSHIASRQWRTAESFYLPGE